MWKEYKYLKCKNGPTDEKIWPEVKQFHVYHTLRKKCLCQKLLYNCDIIPIL